MGGVWVQRGHYVCSALDPIGPEACPGSGGDMYDNNTESATMDMNMEYVGRIPPPHHHRVGKSTSDKTELLIEMVYVRVHQRSRRGRSVPSGHGLG